MRTRTADSRCEIRQWADLVVKIKYYWSFNVKLTAFVCQVKKNHQHLVFHRVTGPLFCTFGRMFNLIQMFYSPKHLIWVVAKCHELPFVIISLNVENINSKMREVHVCPLLAELALILLCCDPQRRRGAPSTAAMTATETTPKRRSNGDSGLTSQASSSRSWRLPSRGTATRTWAPGRRSPCGPTWPRPECG